MSGLPVWSPTPIGVIRSPYPDPAGVPIQPIFAEAVEGRVELEPAFAAGLEDLAGFERIWLLTWLHRAGPPRLRMTPFLDTHPHGVFATRAPVRPNPIGLSCVRLLGVAGLILHIAGVDVVDGTPLLDLKPYIPRFDAFPSSRAGWCDAAPPGSRTAADDRFVTDG